MLPMNFFRIKVIFLFDICGPASLVTSFMTQETDKL